MNAPDTLMPVSFMDWPQERLRAFANAWNDPNTTATGVAQQFELPTEQARLLAHRLRTAKWDMLIDEGKRHVTEKVSIPAEIQTTLDAVTLSLAFRFDVDADEIRSECREQRCVKPRRALAWAARYIGLSWKQIAKYLGRGSHTSALNMFQSAKQPEISAAREALAEMVEQPTEEEIRADVLERQQDERNDR